MRVLVLVLAALAGLKVWASNHMYRQATEEIIVAAYRERAIAACQKDAGRMTHDGKAVVDGPAATRMTVLSWTHPGSIRLVVGKHGVGVTMWDVDNAEWQARFKQVYLMLRPSETGSGPACEYDISANRAMLVRG